MKSGIDLISEYLSGARIFVSVALKADGETHGVSDVVFSDALKENSARLQTLDADLKRLLSLFYELEREKGLRRTLREGSVLSGLLPDPRLGGMNLLLLFSERILRLKEDGASLTLYAHPVFFQEVFDPDGLLFLFGRKLLSFDGLKREVRVLPCTLPFMKTDRLGDRMDITYAYDQKTEEMLLRVRENIFTDGDALYERERIVMKNREMAMDRISHMITDIEEASSNFRNNHQDERGIRE